MIPNSVIVSLERVKREPDLLPVIAENQHVFGKNHPDTEQLALATFLLYHFLKGKDSFWHPYLSVMNESDITAYWQSSEIEQLKDVEIITDTETYKNEIELEWEMMDKVFA